MNAAEKRAFADLLAGLLDIYGRQLTPASAGLWWSAFEPHSLADVSAAFSRYTQDPDQGRYPPTPAAVLACLPSSGASRLNADEAWALALDAMDESATVCATDEILEAVAAPSWEIGDKVGARMAFKGAYERIASERRRRGIAPVWTLSLGWDAEKRAQTAQEALRLGRITEEQALPYLPSPAAQGAAQAVAGLLTGKVVEFPLGDDAKARANLKRLRDAIAEGVLRRDGPEPDVEREQLKRRKDAALLALEAMKHEMSGIG